MDSARLWKKGRAVDKAEGKGKTRKRELFVDSARLSRIVCPLSNPSG